MGKYLKVFNNHSQYEAFTATTDFIRPNVSFCKGVPKEVHYNPIVATILVAKYNITSTSSPTQISYNGYYGDGTSGFSEIEIDGTKLPNVVSSYTFNTIGEHTVKYTLKEPTKIGKCAFDGCSKMTSISIPNNITIIGAFAFGSCTNLTSIDIPSGVTIIENSTFGYCENLTSITIPSGVTSIGSSAFERCRGLNNITINATTPPTLINTDAFDYTNNCVIYVPSESEQAYKTANKWSSLASRIEAIPN